MAPPAAGGINWNALMKGGQLAQKAMGDGQQPQAVHAQRPPQAGQVTPNAEILKRLQYGMPGRSNFAGLLGRF